ncbi:MAG: hypothetical protein J0L64_09685 [Acidobacteria bacterium]|nr:hypothetical protein [Acidobacteriota bacterium]
MPHHSLTFAWKHPAAAASFRTGVSLHSHTLHSVESLTFIPRVASRIPVLMSAIDRQRDKYRALHGRDLDLHNAHWTPPLSAQQAYSVESSQIEALGLAPLVSLSDHDNLDAAGRLHMVEETRHVPISVEWTVPFDDSFFHLGIHNLPPARAHAMMEAMAEYTASATPARLGEILEWIAWNEEVLVVFNHPCWDEKGVGAERHDLLSRRFLRGCGRWVHALELNGLRPWAENQRAIALATDFDRPVVSGGDRHGCEPNANINLTNAATFGEFVSEVRAEGISHVHFLPQYADSLVYRQIQCIADVLGDQPAHSLGWTSWNSRIFYRLPSGELQPLSRLWTRGAPWIVASFVNLIRASQQRHMRSALKVWLTPQREFAG